MVVNIPTPLRSYTGGAPEVEASGASLDAVLASLDASYPGIRFRVVDEQDQIRPHIKLFVGAELAASLEEPVGDRDEVHIICALSGG
jgi:molybdopterin synthase sulfur carrier subunit